MVYVIVVAACIAVGVFILALLKAASVDELRKIEDLSEVNERKIDS